MKEARDVFYLLILGQRRGEALMKIGALLDRWSSEDGARTDEGLGMVRELQKAFDEFDRQRLLDGLLGPARSA